MKDSAKNIQHYRIKSALPACYNCKFFPLDGKNGDLCGIGEFVVEDIFLGTCVVHEWRK